MGPPSKDSDVQGHNPDRSGFAAFVVAVGIIAAPVKAIFAIAPGGHSRRDQNRRGCTPYSQSPADS